MKTIVQLGMAGASPGPSDSVAVVPRLAPARAHPPPTAPRATTCYPSLLPRQLGCCLAAGRFPRPVVARSGRAERWGPCGCQASRRRSMHGCPKCVRERAPCVAREPGGFSALCPQPIRLPVAFASRVRRRRDGGRRNWERLHESSVEYRFKKRG